MIDKVAKAVGVPAWAVYVAIGAAVLIVGTLAIFGTDVPVELPLAD